MSWKRLDLLKLRHKGFTLIEVLIALSILSFIIIAIAQITGSSKDKADIVIAEDLDLLQVETAFSRIEWDISHLYTPLYWSQRMESTGMDQTEMEVFNDLINQYASNQRFPFPSFDAYPIPQNAVEKKKSFTFFSMANRRKFKNQKQSNFAWVRYEVVNERNLESANTSDETLEKTPRDEVPSEKLVLIRKILADNVFDTRNINWDDIKGQVLLRHITKLTLEFWNPENRKWSENLSTIKDGAFVIRGVKLTLNWIDMTGIEREFIRVYRPLFPSYAPENLYKFMYPSHYQEQRPI